MKFNGEKAYKFIEEKLNFPRRTGSEGSVEAIENIQNDLKEEDYEVKIQEFEYVHSYFREALVFRIGISIFFLLMVILSLLASFQYFLITPIDRYIFLLISIICAFVQMTLVYINVRIRYEKYLHEKFAQKITVKEEYELPTAKNIIIEKESAKKSNKHIIIGAHYDSISINYPAKFWIVTYIVSFIGPLILGIFYIILDVILFLSPPPLTPAASATVIVAMTLASIVSVFIIMWLGLKLGNESNGASDNASGVAILREIARVVKDEKFNFKLSLIFFGVEEEGLLGSINYVKNNLDQLKKENVMMISLDTLGTDGQLTYASGHGFPKHEYDQEIISEIDKAAKEADVDIKPKWFLYPSSDHAGFVFKGLKATQLFSNTIVANTRQDTIDNISPENLEKAGKVVLQFLKNQNS
jgi:hypothetical protein